MACRLRLQAVGVPTQLEVLHMRRLFGGMVLAAIALALPASCSLSDGRSPDGRRKT